MRSLVILITMVVFATIAFASDHGMYLLTMPNVQNGHVFLGCR